MVKHKKKIYKKTEEDQKKSRRHWPLDTRTTFFSGNDVLRHGGLVLARLQLNNTVKENKRLASFLALSTRRAVEIAEAGVARRSMFFPKM